ELQHRHSAGRVLCKKFGSPALASENIDILQRELDPLFRREDANPAGIWGECMIVKLHCISHFVSSKHHAMTSLPSAVNQFACGELVCPFLGSPIASSFLGYGRSRTKSTSRAPSPTRKSRH